MTDIINFAEKRAHIAQLEAEIERLLEERPEYREWFDSMKDEIDRVGNNRHNRCAAAISIMINKWHDIIDANKELQETWENE